VCQEQLRLIQSQCHYTIDHQQLETLLLLQTLSRHAAQLLVALSLQLGLAVEVCCSNDRPGHEVFLWGCLCAQCLVTLVITVYLACADMAVLKPKSTANAARPICLRASNIRSMREPFVVELLHSACPCLPLWTLNLLLCVLEESESQSPQALLTALLTTLQRCLATSLLRCFSRYCTHGRAVNKHVCCSTLAMPTSKQRGCTPAMLSRAKWNHAKEVMYSSQYTRWLNQIL
jgi:hypothetical protein